MKSNFKIIAVTTFIMIGCLYSCKKNYNNEKIEEKVSSNNIMKTPEKYGYHKISVVNKESIKNLDIKINDSIINRVDKKFIFYYNSQDKSVVMQNREAKNNLNNIAQSYNFIVNSNNCICSGAVTYNTSILLVDDECSIFDGYPSIRIDILDAIVLRGHTELRSFGPIEMWAAAPEADVLVELWNPYYGDWLIASDGPDWFIKQI